jgi:NADH-quinone oxidoreductase subunit N
VLNVRVSAFSDLVVIDAYARFWKILLYGVTGLTILMSLPYLKAERIHLGEYYGFILLALSGMMVMVSGADLLTIYLGTELMSLSLYVMTGLNRSKPRSLEAAAKYFVLGAFSSGILFTASRCSTAWPAAPSWHRSQAPSELAGRMIPSC